MSEEKTSCVETASGPLEAEAAPEDVSETQAKEKSRMTAKVGHKAPDFEAMAFVKGAFKKIQLSSYAGKWITLCFYPGDFTFV